MQKLRHFPPTAFVLESAVKLSVLAEFPSDTYLRYIVSLQGMFEAADDILRSTITSGADGYERPASIRMQLDSFKSTLDFPLSDCCKCMASAMFCGQFYANLIATLSLQVSFLELLIGQMTLPGFPFGNKKLENAIVYDSRLISNLTYVVSASRSLVGFLLSMTPGEEFVITNMVWVMLSCGVSLAVRLDVLVKDPRISPLTQQLVHFLDMTHSIRQILLRLESAASANTIAVAGDENTFHQFLKRARAIETWHKQHLDMISPSGTSVPGLTPGAASEGSSSTTRAVSVPGLFVQPIDPANTLTADSSFLQGAAFNGTMESQQTLGTLDCSILDILFEGQMLPFDAYMPGM